MYCFLMTLMIIIQTAHIVHCSTINFDSDIPRLWDFLLNSIRTAMHNSNEYILQSNVSDDNDVTEETFHCKICYVNKP